MASTKNSEFDVRITGKDIKPESISLSELAEIITSFEASILNAAHYEEQKSDINAVSVSGPFVSLIEITEGSAWLKFKSNLSTVVAPAVAAIVTAINSGNYEDLPTKSIVELSIFTKAIQKKGCGAEIKINSESPIVAHITAETIVQIPDSFFAKGSTNLYGEVQRVGGAIPKVRINLSNREVVSCDISLNLAKALGAKLYSLVEILGEAKWNVETGLVEEFVITNLGSYEDGHSILESFAALSKILEPHWRGIDDVNGEILKIRGHVGG